MLSLHKDHYKNKNKKSVDFSLESIYYIKYENDFEKCDFGIEKTNSAHIQ